MSTALRRMTLTRAASTPPVLAGTTIAAHPTVTAPAG